MNQPSSSRSSTVVTQRPDTVFKYQSFSVQNLRNLYNRVLYFGSPFEFNDPYDCAITIKPKPLNNKEENEIKYFVLKEINELSSKDKEFLKTVDSSIFAKNIWPYISNFLDFNKKKFLTNIGVTCFSAVNDNLLMWSHYADSHSGFCVEYRTEADAIQNIKPVSYCKNMPKIDFKELFINSNFDEFLALLFTKSIDWKYEKEWRAVSSAAGKKLKLSKSDVSAIYFGPLIKNSDRNILMTIASKCFSDIKFYIGSHSSNKFRMEFDEVV